MMKYQFDLKITGNLIATAPDQDAAEALIDKKMDTLLNGSPLKEEYPDSDFSLKERKGTSFTFDCWYTFKASVEATSIADAEAKVPDQVMALLKGSQLEGKPMEIESELSDEQPGLDERLDAIDEDQPFAIAADASMYHIPCAKEQYGEQAIDLAIALSEKYSEDRIISTPKLYEKYPKDDEGNLLHVIWGRDHIHEVREAFAHEEEIYASCQCLNLLYDEPRIVA